MDDAGQRLLDAFSETPLHKLLGFTFVSIDPELVVVEMPVRESAFNSSGNLHGGAIATLIDVAAGTAAARNSSFEPGKNTIATADMHVRYLGRPRADAEVVRAEARVLRAGRQLVVVECKVVDPDGKLVAQCDFASMVVPLRDALRPGEGDTSQPDL